MSRRALLGTVGAGSLFLLLQGLGQSIGGPLREPRVPRPARTSTGAGPNGFPVNRTAAAAAITPAQVGPAWRLQLERRRAHRSSLSRAELLAMPQHAHDLPIACVEGWSTTQHWSGVPIRELAALVGVDGAFTAHTRSLTQNGVFDSATLAAEQTGDPRLLLALHVNGVELSLDHGYPARVIGPGLPGVHCTKWVSAMSFERVVSGCAPASGADYGEGPLHLLALIGALLVTAAAVVGRVRQLPRAGGADDPGVVRRGDRRARSRRAAAVLAARPDRVRAGSSGRGRRRRTADRPAGLVYVRVPVLLSGLIFLVFFPEILGLGDGTFHAASGLHQHVYLARYLVDRGVIFALSAPARYASELCGVADADARAVIAPTASTTQTARSGAEPNSAIPASKASWALKPSSRSARRALANTCRTSPRRNSPVMTGAARPRPALRPALGPCRRRCAACRWRR